MSHYLIAAQHLVLRIIYGSDSLFVLMCSKSFFNVYSIFYYHSFVNFNDVKSTKGPMKRLRIATFVGSPDKELIKEDFCLNYEIGGKSRTLQMQLTTQYWKHGRMLGLRQA